MASRLTKLPMVTLFHNPSSRISIEALRLLKKGANAKKYEIDLVQTKSFPPTHQQLANIVEFMGPTALEEILLPEAPKASTLTELQEILEKQPVLMRKPLIIDWNRAKAFVGDPPQKVKEFVKSIDVKRDK
ncbi:hypothetical protein BC939DRAFT_58333 [Gamsiella multidivaricata]|uniref:uncharacterized protein n=1 Tax=Gamsiella multidivaricata TaxID=101098 RepID=UPI00221E3DB8|nr:uncharacterized protein BC939DRAFT_58333 [Gamsiella multidivaricata]KAG0358217.1 hypothetical protein BGZ54_010532 [Gamsiella multidivaricata]KAI7816140.1 hypothetical protein BC939DRAFT_58333 [Gamsiella multidivaricata]